MGSITLEFAIATRCIELNQITLSTVPPVCASAPLTFPIPFSCLLIWKNNSTERGMVVLTDLLGIKCVVPNRTYVFNTLSLPWFKCLDKIVTTISGSLPLRLICGCLLNSVRPIFLAYHTSVCYFLTFFLAICDRNLPHTVQSPPIL